MNWQTIGFENQKNYFDRLVKTGSLAHAYLFTGPEMIGKFLLAQEIAGRALSTAGFSPDLKIISPKTEEGETKIYVEDIREAKSFLSLSSYGGQHKFVIINDAERLTPEASNALLKSLEEPTPRTTLILISSKPRQLLPTITSRCEEVRFLPHSKETVENCLLENKKITITGQELLVSMAQGRIGWVNSAVERLPEIKKSVSDLADVLKNGIAERMLYSKKIYEKETYATVLNDWLYWLYGNRDRQPKSHFILKCLLDLDAIIKQPQFNHRLALETALISL
ncbi:MAG TPA: AAA family ATPase [Candidatus Paceibacterota bacterium]|nr:AAA family ATPase [Candidatus Paceibacterota bacterium]